MKNMLGMALKMLVPAKDTTATHLPNLYITT